MKLILFSGDHPRHLFVNKSVLEFFDEVFIVVMQREELLPEPPSDLCDHDKQLFKLHFENRYSVESLTYGSLNAREVFKGLNSIFIKPEELNSKLVAVDEFVTLGDSEVLTSDEYFVTIDSGYQKSEEGNPLTVGLI